MLKNLKKRRALPSASPAKCPARCPHLTLSFLMQRYNTVEASCHLLSFSIAENGEKWGVKYRYTGSYERWKIFKNRTADVRESPPYAWFRHPFSKKCDTWRDNKIGTHTSYRINLIPLKSVVLQHAWSAKRDTWHVTTKGNAFHHLSPRTFHAFKKSSSRRGVETRCLWSALIK